MTSPADRFVNWINSLAAMWGERLRGWIVGWLSGGARTYLESLEPEIIASTRETVEKIIKEPDISPELKTLLEKSLESGDIITVITGWLMTLVGGFLQILSWGAPVGRLMEYTQDQVHRTARLGPDQIMRAWLREPELVTPYFNDLRDQGWSEDRLMVLRLITEYRLDPLSIITAWRRDPAKYERLFKDLKDQGWTQDRIEAVKFATQAYPSLQDVIRFYAREAFEPDMIERYGLADELPPYTGTLFEKLGVPEDVADLYWIAHWEHASWNQVVEMLRRGQLTEEEVYQWYRVVEIPPYWRDKLTAISWNVPTRVDVRRFWDMRTIDEARLREIYTAQGYHGKDLDDYVLWTKVYVAFPDLMARWRNGWITIEAAESELIGLGMPADRAREMIETKLKAEEPSPTIEGKNLTKTEIYKGVKLGLISYQEGIELLTDLGYSSDQAEFLLLTNVQVLTGSPEMFIDFKDMTQKYRRAAGLGGKPLPEELKAAGAAVVRLNKEVEDLTRAVKEEEDKIADEETASDEVLAPLKAARVARNRALAELHRVKTDYDALLAQWKHGE